MKCEIIRDLMPLHLDGLTSEESDQAIKEHLNGCEPCKEILEQMKQETEVKPEEVKKEESVFDDPEQPVIKEPAPEPEADPEPEGGVNDGN